MTIWTFHQSGTIPGVVGTFAGVRVDVDDETNAVLSVTPLSTHVEFEEAQEVLAQVVETPPVQEEPAPAQEGPNQRQKKSS